MSLQNNIFINYEYTDAATVRIDCSINADNAEDPEAIKTCADIINELFSKGAQRLYVEADIADKYTQGFLEKLGFTHTTHETGKVVIYSICNANWGIRRRR